MNIEFCPNELQVALERVNALAPKGLGSVDAIVAQSELQVALRKLIASIPNELFTGSRSRDFLTLLRGEPPGDEVVGFVQVKARSLRLTEDQYLAVERRQGGRCSWCGVILANKHRPNIDHIFPLALGGDDSLENIQLLCGRCNQGKGLLIHWVMGAPWFSRRGHSNRVRYCVLGRYQSRCSVNGCPNDASNSELFVDLIIPRAFGGSAIFDNLSTYCGEHKRELELAQEKRTKVALRGVKAARTRIKLPLK
jgi:hypothetical protein